MPKVDWNNVHKFFADKPAHLTERWNPHTKPRTQYPCAILSSDKTVLAIRMYPRATNSNNVVEIPLGLPVRPGWTFRGGKFHPPGEF